jgi:hypothetical protein
VAVSDNNYLRNYVRLSHQTEIPTLFTVWCGIAGISCALGRRVWIDMGQYHIFPNFYIVLVAGSGRLRKSTAIGTIEGILRKVEPPFNLIAQKITPEGLIDAIKITETNDATKLFAERCEGFIIADELATLINKNSFEAGLASLLIPLFDCKESFSYRTVGRGEQRLSNTCLGILGASTVDWIARAIPENAVGGGLTSRIIFVYVQEPAPPVARTTYTQEKRELAEWLRNTTQQLTSLSGQVQLTDAAWAEYEREYNEWVGPPSGGGTGESFYENPNLSGYASRRNMHLLKLATILAVSDTYKLVVERSHVLGAKALLEDSEKNMPLVLSLITTSEQGQLINAVHNIVKRGAKNGVNKQEILRDMSNKINTRELDLLLDTLEHAGQVKKVIQGSGTRYYPQA